MRISNDGYINPSVVVGDRMVTEVERITNSIITDKYWGNSQFVLKYLIPHKITNQDSFESYGHFYWIRILPIFLEDTQGLVV
ncbi:hypothetical protein LQK80_36920 [Bacillus thuringiensis]|nr:hypothetical protein [Bacillus thuringiensis]